MDVAGDAAGVASARLYSNVSNYYVRSAMDGAYGLRASGPWTIATTSADLTKNFALRRLAQFLENPGHTHLEVIPKERRTGLSISEMSQI